MSDESGEPENVPSYAFKPSLMGAMFAYELHPDGIAFVKGRYSGRVHYSDITRLRLSYRPVTMLNNRFNLEIWSRGVPRLQVSSGSWRSMVEMKSQGAEFSSFVRELHRRVAAGGYHPRCDTGIWPPLYWVGFAIFTATSLGLAFLAVRALQIAAWGGVLFIAAFLAVFLWQAGQFFRRNRPGSYRLEDPPAAMLPPS